MIEPNRPVQPAAERLLQPQEIAAAKNDLDTMTEACAADLRPVNRPNLTGKVRESLTKLPLTVCGIAYAASSLRETTVGRHVFRELVDGDTVVASWDDRGIGVGEYGLTNDPADIESILAAVGSFKVKILADQDKAIREAQDRSYGPPRGPILNDGFY